MSGKVEDAASAASAMEAYFLRRILGEVKTSGLGGDGFAADTFKEMMDDALATAMTDAGGVGLADLVARELEDHPKTAQPRNPVDDLDALKFRGPRPNL